MIHTGPGYFYRKLNILSPPVTLKLRLRSQNQHELFVCPGALFMQVWSKFKLMGETH